MEAIDQLLTFAEISIALAGFAGIIATFQIRQQLRISRGHVLSITLIIIISLCGAFNSVFPVALYNFGMDQQSIWSFSSLIGGAFWTYGFFYTLRRLRLDRVGQVSRITFVILMLLVIVAAAVNFMNAFGIVFDQEYGPFFAAFIFGYGLVLYNFSLLLLHPLWRKIHDQESEAPG